MSGDPKDPRNPALPPWMTVPAVPGQPPVQNPVQPPVQPPMQPPGQPPGSLPGMVPGFPWGGAAPGWPPGMPAMPGYPPVYPMPGWPPAQPFPQAPWGAPAAPPAAPAPVAVAVAVAPQATVQPTSQTISQPTDQPTSLAPRDLWAEYAFGEDALPQKVQVTVLEAPRLPAELPSPTKIDPGLEQLKIALEARLARNAVAPLMYVPPNGTRWFRFSPFELFMEQVLARRLWTLE